MVSCSLYVQFVSALFILCCFMVNLAMVVRNLATDQSSLLHFKDHILDPHNVLAKNWTKSSSVCSWIGVSCGIKHTRVTSLNLTNMSLTGSIPPHLGNLSFLVHLDLSNNNFHGRPAKELEHLRRLSLIDLSFNGFNGEIPSWFGNLHKVKYLSLLSNNLTGTIPPTLANMSNVEVLILGYNQLVGFIPSTIFNMSSLRLIYLATNQLSGTLPDDLCRNLPKLEIFAMSVTAVSGHIPSRLNECSKLKVLALSINRFTGMIPTSIGNLTAIKEVYLGENNLEGEIPKEIGNLGTLELFAAEMMNLTGPIPPSIFNISSLKDIRLHTNNLSGSLPDDLCVRLPMLERVYLSKNALSGHIPSSIGKCNNLQNLSLTYNQFTGLIPTSIGNLTRLEALYLGGNSLQGNIPDSISNISTLSMLSLGYNSLSGLIPNALGNLRQLEWLYLQNNNFTTKPPAREWSFLSSIANCINLKNLVVSENPLMNGMLPAAAGNLSKSLQIFHASGCSLSGNIPAEIGNLSSLLLVSLENNELSGSIPAAAGRLRNLQGLYLTVNKLQGSIPQSVCGLGRLYRLDLSSNKLHGPILPCLGNLTSLGYLYLGSNIFTSAIPSTLWRLNDVLEIDLSSNYLSTSHPLDLGDLRALVKLNLSRNLLTSNISSTVLGDSESLVSLDLSYNQLRGQIPESFGRVISLECLDLCNNSLSGVIPKSLEKLLNLKFLNVSFNRLEGEIPSGGPFGNFSSKSFINNYALCGPSRFLVPPCKTGIHGHSKPLRVLTYCLPIIASTILIIVAFILLRKKCQRRSTKLPVKEDPLPLKAWRRISHAELLQATDGFADCNLLGSGSFGCVYKGRLSDGTDVAVKVFNLQIEGAFKSFDVECDAMRDIIHRNLVKVITCCSNVDFKALVLDFMPNGSLEKWLHSQDHSLDMVQRMDIMIDVGSALEYLHVGHSTSVVHCDLKPSNIVLDEDMVAHVADFGIAKLLGEGDVMTQTMTLATIGYMAPEFGSVGIVSTKCDIYSFGILLMETFTKRKPTDEIFSETMTMRQWVKNSVSKGMIDIADANLLRREDEFFIVKANCISSIMELALDCSAELPEERKDTKDVVASLKKIKHKFLSKIEQL